MITDYILQKFIQTYKEPTKYSELKKLKKETVEYRKLKIKRKRCRKPTTIFDERFINEIKKEKERVEYYFKYCNIAQDLIEEYKKITDEYIRVWSLYAQRV